ncbi:MAG: hypothetical protein ABI948_07180 [Thermoleophilia bacterium]
MASDRAVDVDAELDRLYGLPLAEFTKARNDLAARLKKAGESDAAAEVKALAKPSIPAWAVNQLARTRKRDVRALLDAAERSGKAKSLRESLDEQRDALQRLTNEARKLLEAERGSAPDAMVQRIASTLRAAASDPAAAELLERGRVNEDLEPAGFESLAGLVGAKTPPASKQDESDADRKRLEAAQKAVRDRKAEAAELHDRAEESERQAAKVRKAADRADRALADAEAELRSLERSE